MTSAPNKAHQPSDRWLHIRCDDREGDIYYAVHRKSDSSFIANVYGDPSRARLIAAAPTLLEAARTGLKLMESELALILECHCLLDPKMKPIRETLDEDRRAEVEALEAKIAQVRSAIADATVPA